MAMVLGVTCFLSAAFWSVLLPARAEVDTGSGKVQTLAGPWFCQGTGTEDPSSTWVRQLAVDPSGQFYFVTGRVQNPVIGRVATGGKTTLFYVGGSSPLTAAGARILAGSGGSLIVVNRTGLAQLPVGSASPAPGLLGQTGIDLGSSWTVIAGDPTPRSGPAASAGDAGKAVSARFTEIAASAEDEDGNLYLADRFEPGSAGARIRFLNMGDHPVTFYGGTTWQMSVAPGSIDTIAGSGPTPNSGDGGPARSATFSMPSALAVAAGRLYVGYPPPGASEPEVRIINLGSKEAVANGPQLAPGTVNKVGLGSNAASVSALSADVSGNLYVADDLASRVLKVAPSGLIRTFAGGAGTPVGPAGFNGNGRAADGALLNHAADVKVAPSGRVLIADTQNGQVRLVDRAGVIRAAGGSGLGLSPVCGLPGRPEGTASDNPKRGLPVGVARGPGGSVYFVEYQSRQLKRWDPPGRVTAVAGYERCQTERCRGIVSKGEALGQLTMAIPTAIAIRPDGNLYIFDVGAPQVRLVNLGSKKLHAHGLVIEPGTAMTVAGTGFPGAGGDEGPAIQAQLTPVGSDTYILGSIAADSRGNLFVADPINHRVRRVDDRGIITTFAGIGSSRNRASCCMTPVGLAIDPHDNLLVSDRATARVWLINRQHHKIPAWGRSIGEGDAGAVAGDGRVGFSGDGGAASAAELNGFVVSAAVAADRKGNLYIAEGNDVRRVDPEGLINTVMGSGEAGFNGDGQAGQLTSVNVVTGLAIDSCGNLVVSDLLNGRVRRLNAASCQSQGASGRSSPWFWLMGGGMAILGVMALVLGVRKLHRAQSE